MNKYVQYFVLLILFLAVVSAGLAIGHYFSNAKSAIEGTTTVKKEEQKEPADYLAAFHSYGPLIQTQKIEVIFNDDNDSAKGGLPLELEGTIQDKQNVILYDEDQITLPLGGTVKKITKTETNLEITISLPEGTNTEYLLPKLDIITLETSASKRLPLGALQEDENGKTYVWIARKNKDKTYQVNKRHINTGLQNFAYFEEDGFTINADDLIIINPDKKLKKDTAYTIETTELIAPLHNPIRQAWIDYELQRLEQQQEELKQVAEDCRNGVGNIKTGDITTADGTKRNSGSSCGGGALPLNDPLLIFQTLTGTASGSASCGASSTSCGQ